MKIYFAAVVVVLLCGLGRTWAAPPAFEKTSSPAGWTVVGKAAAAKGESLQPEAGATPLVVRTEAPLELPVSATFRFRAAPGDSLTLSALAEGADAKAKPLLMFRFTPAVDNRATVLAQADGAPMATDTVSTRTYSGLDKNRGSLIYAWHFPKVGSLWDEQDRREIGASYAPLAPFAERVFAVRVVLTPERRQLWLDDRLVAEEQVSTSGRVQLELQLANTASVLSAAFAAPVEAGLFHPLPLGHYSHVNGADTADDELKNLPADAQLAVPMFTGARGVDVDLGQSIYRYRNTTGTGPNAGYVNAQRTWPSAFEIDPAKLTFRVPYRVYRNVWLLAWKDDDANAVAKGTFRFFREDSGYPASTDFEISDAAVASGLVKPLAEKTADGKQFYLVKIPVDTAAFYGMQDLKGQSIDFELTKPVQLTRSYPDPIYYGYHPAGLPSSIHVAGITLEESPISFEVKPAQFGHVFEQPEKLQYAVAVTNHTDKPLEASVRLATRSHDGTESTTETGTIKLAPKQTGDANFAFNLKQNGWHELKAEVEAGGASRDVTLSLLNLPPNTRTYGTAANEIRFGSWNLLGHYQPLATGNPAANEPFLAMLRKLGVRQISLHEAFFSAETLKKHDLVPDAPHTIVAIFHRLNENDPEALKKAVADELAQVQKLVPDFPATTSYMYGGEWHISQEVQYGQWPAYTGEGDRDLTEDERGRIVRHTKIWTAIGKAMREKFPGVKLYLQWGAPKGTIAYMRNDFPKELVDGFGMDAPMFELVPEMSNAPGSINDLWTVRQEARKFGWKRLPIGWVEGPFFPTNPGALTMQQQADHQVRYMLAGMAYGIEQFQAGIVPFDAGNYYGAEHYGAGAFHRTPLRNPKPAAAAFATMTSMLNGVDPVGPVDTGVLTTYCMAFRNASTQKTVHALWRVEGTVDATVKVSGGAGKVTVTNAMGNATELPVTDGAVKITISPSPVWLTGAEAIGGFSFAEPKYADAPAAVTRPLAKMTADAWSYDGAANVPFETNHFAVKRVADAGLKAVFDQGEDGHADAVAIELEKQPNDRPLATRYGTLVAKQPIAIPGKATALGLWVKGNSSWGRVVYQLRDAKGELWTSAGMADDWNCDDPHAWSYVDFEGWRYVRFPLPGHRPWDAARELETTWWGSRDGDGIVDLPLAVERIFVEARNEVPYLGEFVTVPERAYKLSGLVAEYADDAAMTPEAIAANSLRAPVVEWSGPTDNPIARLAKDGDGEAPAIRQFTEPGHFNDGRRMTIHFEQDPAKTYKLYVSRYADGRGADLLNANVKDQQIVTGLRPETEMYLFLTSVQDKKESKPSAPQRLITHDNFREK